MNIVLIDNFDSFVYNLVDAFSGLDVSARLSDEHPSNTVFVAHHAENRAADGGRYDGPGHAHITDGTKNTDITKTIEKSDLTCTVVRNTASIEDVLRLNPDLICLSPGPGHPHEAGMMMDLIDRAIGRIPLLGVCLGFQAMLDHFGGTVRPCGPVHGQSVPMELTAHGQASPLFEGLTTDSLPGQPGTHVPVARYHSLGCTDTPAGMTALATTASSIGPIVMAAETTDHLALGFQFHPESLLTPAGPTLLARAVTELVGI